MEAISRERSREVNEKVVNRSQDESVFNVEDLTGSGDERERSG